MHKLTAVLLYIAQSKKPFREIAHRLTFGFFVGAGIHTAVSLATFCRTKFGCKSKRHISNTLQQSSKQTDKRQAEKLHWTI